MNRFGKLLRDYTVVTVCIIATTLGIHYFRVPNHFAFGGMTGLAQVLAMVLPVSTGVLYFFINLGLLLLGFLVLGRQFGAMTTYASLLLSVGLPFMERYFPVTQPLTNQPILELCYAIAIPAISSAVLFHMGASTGGADIIALILKKYTSMNISTALLVIDLVVVASSFFLFSVQSAMYSVLGLVAKSVVVDNAIENFSLCKYFNIICDQPEPICDFIINQLNHSATVCEAKGAFTHQKKYIVFTVLKRPQAHVLRKFVRQTEPTAFILITNTSEIIGKGFASQ